MKEPTDLQISAGVRRELSGRRVDLNSIKIAIKSGKVTLSGKLNFVGLEKTLEETAIELKFIESGLKMVRGVKALQFELENWKKNSAGIWESTLAIKGEDAAISGDGVTCGECGYEIRFCPCCGKPLFGSGDRTSSKAFSGSFKQDRLKRKAFNPPPIKAVPRKVSATPLFEDKKEKQSTEIKAVPVSPTIEKKKAPEQKIPIESISDVPKAIKEPQVESLAKTSKETLEEKKISKKSENLLSEIPNMDELSSAESIPEWETPEIALPSDQEVSELELPEFDLDIQNKAAERPKGDFSHVSPAAIDSDKIKKEKEPVKPSKTANLPKISIQPTFDEAVADGTFDLGIPQFPAEPASEISDPPAFDLGLDSPPPFEEPPTDVFEMPELGLDPFSKPQPPKAPHPTVEAPTSMDGGFELGMGQPPEIPSDDMLNLPDPFAGIDVNMDIPMEDPFAGSPADDLFGSFLSDSNQDPFMDEQQPTAPQKPNMPSSAAPHSGKSAVPPLKAGTAHTPVTAKPQAQAPGKQPEAMPDPFADIFADPVSAEGLDFGDIDLPPEISPEPSFGDLQSPQPHGGTQKPPAADPFAELFAEIEGMDLKEEEPQDDAFGSFQNWDTPPSQPSVQPPAGGAPKTSSKAPPDPGQPKDPFDFNLDDFDLDNFKF
ncbi:MAG: hypothetical protein GX221_02985 [Candidatus Riflebacteria bacterium]|nr:hypothetical protein [Candidatus Riflebacteria bacterium]